MTPFPNRILKKFCFPAGLLFAFVLLSMATGTLSAQIQLNDGQWINGQCNSGQQKTYFFDVYDWNSELDLSYLVRSYGSTTRNQMTIWIRHGAIPTNRDFDIKIANAGLQRDVMIDSKSSSKLKTGRYFIKVRSLYSTIKFSLRATRSITASEHSGMGAIPYGEGTAFRVWAPFADSVHVSGDFNGWHSFNAPLTNEGNGHWSLDFRNAHPGQQYLYVIRRGDQELWRTDPREQEVTNSVGNSVIFDDHFDWTDQNLTTPNWNEMVIYEMHVGTFYDSPGGGPGNFDSAIAKLDYLAELGVNAVCVMPINEFAGDFSWGYNPAFPFAVESAYGGPNGFREFVNAAHEHNIAVLLDLCHNHYGPSDLDLWRFDGWWEDRFGGIYFYQDQRSDTQWGNTRPDFGRNEVRQYIRDNVLMWMEDFHVDGFRWDSVLNMRTYNFGELPDGWSLMQWINDEIDYRQPWCINIAEDLQSNPWITRDTYEGGAGFDSQWDADFVHPVREVIEGTYDNDRDMERIRWAVNHGYSSDSFSRVIYTESHDEVANGRSRVPETIWPGNAGSWFSKKRSTLGAALVMTSPGIPMIFQGQEILEDGYFQDSDPVDWSKLQTFGGIRLMYQDLIRLRRNWHNNTRGLQGHHVNCFHVNNNDKMVAFHRWERGGAGDDVIVICNFRDTTWNNYRIGLPRGGVWRVRFNSDWQGYSDDFGNFFSPDVTAENMGQDGLDFSGNVQIGPYSVLILSQD